jgi:dienelactone hydrolase
MSTLATAYAKRGFVAASVEYRMDEAAGDIGYPPPASEVHRVVAAKHDVQAAVRWLRRHAADHRIDPGKIAVSGVSAGGVTAVLVATTADDPGTSGTPGVSSAVCTAVSVMGAGDPALVDPSDAGALSLHGDQDRVVAYDRARDTSRAMAAAGLSAELVTFAGTGHSLFGPSLVEQRAADWMVEHVVDRTGGCAQGAASDAAFVRAVYEDLLGQAPTAVERAAELRALGQGTRAAVLTRLTVSDAWLGAIVTDLYTATLGRPPDVSGLAFWVETLRSGRYSVARVAASFLAADEYHARAGGTDEAWVAALYREVLGRPATAGDVEYWVAQAGLHGRGSAARNVYGSLESRRDRVTELYEHLLGRRPERDGLDYWADRVAREGDLALARSLAASAEYAARARTRFPSDQVTEVR